MGSVRALYFETHGDTTGLVVGERPQPQPGPGEVVVRVRAAALNHLDLFVLRGLPGAPVELPHIGGADGAGTVADVGGEVTGWQVGDGVVLNPGLWCGQCEFCRRGEESQCVRFRIVGEHVDGTFAEYVKVPVTSLAPKPPHLTWPEASAFGLTFLTAWRMLVSRAGLSAGESVLIHGIGGGVALAALAIAKRLGATVFVTSSSDAKLARAAEMGADHTLNYTSADVPREVRSLTDKRGVDVVVETVGAATWMGSLRSVAKGGRIVTCGATSGANPGEEIRLVFWNQLSILGSTMGSCKDWQAMVRAVQGWKLHPVIDSMLTLDEGRAAYKRMAKGEQFGKIVLNVAGNDSAAGQNGA
jgi:NADPH:quinone reductase-like Zn-dependent oxidoreductase